MAKEKMTSAKKVINQLNFAIAEIEKLDDEDHVVCVIAQFEGKSKNYRVDIHVNKGV